MSGGGLSILCTGLALFGGDQERSAQKKIARQNAAALEEQARQERAQAEREAQSFSRESEIVFGDKVSSFAKAGVDISGSPLAVLASTKQQALEDERIIRRNGLERSGATRARAQQQRDQDIARLFRVAAEYINEIHIQSTGSGRVAYDARNILAIRFTENPLVSAEQRPELANEQLSEVFGAVAVRVEDARVCENAKSCRLVGGIDWLVVFAAPQVQGNSAIVHSTVFEAGGDGLAWQSVYRLVLERQDGIWTFVSARAAIS